MLYKIEDINKEVPVSAYNDKTLFAGNFNNEEFKTYNEQYFHFPKEVLLQLKHYQNSPNRISKIDAYPEYYIGEITLLNNDKTAYEATINFLIRKNLLVLICDDEVLQKHYHSVFLAHDTQIITLERLVFLFLDDCIQEDTLMIDSIQQKLIALDEKVFHNVPIKFNQQMEIPRRQIRMLDHNYDHLLEIGEELVDNELEFFDADTRYFKILKDRFSRLHNAIMILQDYMNTIRESHQSNIDNDLNHTMKLLTVLTAIFQPLTLIVGWYGMNFYNMPELTWVYGYPLVILLSIGSIVCCYWIFKKKKML